MIEMCICHTFCSFPNFFIFLFSQTSEKALLMGAFLLTRLNKSDTIVSSDLRKVCAQSSQINTFIRSDFRVLFLKYVKRNPSLNPGVSSQGSNEIDIDDKETYFIGNEMNKDFSFMTIIRLQCDLEHALEQRDLYAHSSNNLIMFTLWDETVDLIVQEIMELQR